MSELIERLKKIKPKPVRFESLGRVKGVVGAMIDVEGLAAPLGARCEVESRHGNFFADVVGFANGKTKIQPLNSLFGTQPNTKVRLVSEYASIEISDSLKGKIIDPTGKVLVGSPVSSGERKSIDNPPLKINERGLINKNFDTGIKAIGSMFPIGVGQRVGLFAGTGVGKSVLLSMITKNSEADVVVIALVGERGREVTEFYEETLDDESRSKSIIVAAPADTSPIMRMQCAEAATAVAEHYRDKGLNVLLLVDSVTRYAQAQREVALSCGEAPATKGYPPSVFAKLPYLIERAGKAKFSGSITAIYTVLTEGDDLNDPVADAARGVLDGHIVLSRELASKGVYPAIDVNASISRLAHALLVESQLNAINEIKSYFHILNENAELINMGVVEKGKNKKLDLAIQNESFLWDLVKQNVNEKYTCSQSLEQLVDVKLKFKEFNGK